MEIRIEVENIRCAGCANSIRKKLLEDDRVQSVDVHIEEKMVIVNSKEENIYVELAQILLKLGYPEKDSVEGIQALKGKAKSMVSCAIGKIS
jgi:copper chaperone